jgi:hypothetical protein
MCGRSPWAALQAGQAAHADRRDGVRAGARPLGGQPADLRVRGGAGQGVAGRLGLDAVVVKQVRFTALAGGELGGADITLSQLTPTEKRKRSLDVTTA